MTRSVFSLVSLIIAVSGFLRFPVPVKGDIGQLDGKCPRMPSPGITFCTRVKDWQDLKRVVNIANRQNDAILILCPFHIIDKGIDDSATITTSMYLGCSEPHECIIDGGGTHIVIEGKNTSSIIQGIVFRGASKPALRVLPTTEGHQMICHCNFILNRVKDERGGSIKTEKDSAVTVGFCLFEQNRGIEGSAIYNRGQMEIYHSTFTGNHASGVSVT
uniref:Right handed beta helix domain-containing protein n=1 Tax=Eucampia antarctica TaxID=49252 RepID=A0A7S2SHF6_9STRA|mmetsp:Transcript_8348/g.7889  ORF Transcript_8348/g.7889 Transcript_8348/m.7889 type:complete len:217 (+) Transcript_8348:57-707(+)